jgi:hypothetical protein
MAYKAYDPKVTKAIAERQIAANDAARRRDPERIPRILEKLGKLWLRYPDMRLGQLLNNAKGTDGADLFYLEDDVLEKRIDEGFGNDAPKTT